MLKAQIISKLEDSIREHESMRRTLRDDPEHSNEPYRRTVKTIEISEDFVKVKFYYYAEGQQWRNTESIRVGRWVE